MSSPVLIFGATGSIGRNTLFAASARGVKPYLALRDPAKAIPGLTAEAEAAGGFKRIQADLNKPESLTAAVKESGAKSAFAYAVPDADLAAMKASFVALKDAGLEYIVLLSSFGLRGPSTPENLISSINQTSAIQKRHADAELALAESGLQYAAVRAAFFATNVLWNKPGILAGEVELYQPDIKFDNLAPEDIGAVCGALLARGPSGPGEVVYTCGPELLTQRETYAKIASATGKELKITEIGKEKFIASTSKFLPAPIVDSILKMYDVVEMMYSGVYEEGRQNVEKFKGEKGMGFDEWAKKNKFLFD